MLTAILILLIISVALAASIAWMVYSAKSGTQLLEAVGQTVTQATAALNARLDSVQQGLSTSFTMALQSTTQGIMTSVMGVKEETRSRLDEKIAEFSQDMHSAFDGFSGKVDTQMSNTRGDVQTALTASSALLDQRLVNLQTQISQGVAELQRATREELAAGRRETRESLDASARTLAEAFSNLQAGNEAKLTEIRQSLEAKLTENVEKSIDAFKEMTAGITELKTTGEKIMQVSEEIGELTDILRSPKMRADFGEFELENMLRDVIPPEHYRVKAKVDGAIADAAILLKEGFLCIDSKFPLDNFRRSKDPELPPEDRERARKDLINDVWGYVDSIADKYIVPGVTLDLALIFVPAESVYYEMLLDRDLQQHCREKKVLPVSPNTLYTYLQVLAIGFRGMMLQEAAKRIQEVLLKMKRDFDVFKESFRLVGTHIQRAQERFTDANLAVQGFSATLDRLQLGAIEATVSDVPALPPAVPGDTT